MTGTQIGNYKILEKLGEGGMGVVYKGVDVNLDRIVAIKALNTELTGNPELEQRFRAEAKAQANLNHTNLATLYALLIEEGRPWMVMEFIEGETFEQIVQRRGPIPSNDTLPLFRQALLGIGYAHRMGIIHRDIKPSNLMLNKQGIVKVMDFGIAKVLGSRGMTKTGTQMGTAFYMSPEQVLNRGVDIRSDIYSLGVTLYEMLTANVPFQGDSDYQVMTDHVNAPPPLPTKFYPYIPLGLQNAVLKSLAKSPDSRFQTVEEFGTALEQPDTFGIDATPAPAAVPVPPVSRGATRMESAEPAVVTPSVPPPVASDPPPLPAAALPAAAEPSAPPVIPSEAPAKASFLTPERRIALVAVLIILLLVGAWAALRPNVKNRGLPAVADTPSHNQPPAQSSADEPVTQIPNPVQTPAQTPPQAQNKPPAKPEPTTNNIPALPPVQPESRPPANTTPAPSQPSVLAVPAGTKIMVRLLGNVNSIRDRTGQRFEAVIDAPVMVGGRLMISPGAPARVVLTNFGSQVRLELVSIVVNGVNHIVRSNEFEKQSFIHGKPSPVVIIPPATRIVFTLHTPLK